MMERLFLSYSAEKLRQSEDRIQHCLERLSQEQIWWRGADESNSVANLVFICAETSGSGSYPPSDGQPDTRDRDAEFAARGQVRSRRTRTMLAETVDEAVKVIEGVSPQRLTEQFACKATTNPFSKPSTT